MSSSSSSSSTSPSTSRDASNGATLNPLYTEATRRGSVPSRNPLPLSVAQEGEVKEIYYRNVRQKCADEIKDFAQCATGRTVSATWACRAQKLAMNECMLSHASLREQDRAREEWFATREDRRREKQREQDEYERKLRLKREYWGVDDSGRLLDKGERTDSIPLEQAAAFKRRGR